MSEPLLAPPRRSAPKELRDRVGRELERAPRRRLRVRYLVAPLAAAVLVVVTVLGISVLSGQRSADPAGPPPPPAPTTIDPTPVTTTAPPRVKSALQRLDGRPLTEREIGRDTKACYAASEWQWRVSDPTIPYARVQRAAGTEGPTRPFRVIVQQNDVSMVVCENGASPEAAPRTTGQAVPNRATPVVEVENFGTFVNMCGPRNTGDVVTSELYAVTDSVAVGRIRINRGATKGPWQLSTPLGGLVYFPMRLAGADAWSKAITFDVQFLDRSGEQVTIQPYGEKGTKTTKTETTPMITCGFRR